MSRIARIPLDVPAGVEVKLNGKSLTVKGPKGEFDFIIHKDVAVKFEDNQLLVSASENADPKSKAMIGTTRVLLGNIVTGVTKGFEKKLQLVGVGYRAKVQGKNLELTLGYSHDVNFAIPEGIVIETPSNTEVLIKGACKQQVGQVAANIKFLRSVEPYKGKGIRYADEQIKLKDAKKK